MKKTFLFGLLAAALMVSATSCKNHDANVRTDEDVAVKPLEYPEPADTTGGKAANPATREINAVNATEDIKKMQPVM